MGRQVFFDGSHRGRNVHVPEDQVTVSLGGSLPASEPAGMGPDSVGAQYAASLPPTLDPFVNDPFLGGRVATPSAKQVHGQLPGRKVSNGDD